MQHSCYTRGQESGFACPHGSRWAQGTNTGCPGSGSDPLQVHPSQSGSPSVATVTEKQKQGVLLLIRATQALYDTAGAHGYQRREGKIATFPF